MLHRSTQDSRSLSQPIKIKIRPLKLKLNIACKLKINDKKKLMRNNCMMQLTNSNSREPTIETTLYDSKEQGIERERERDPRSL